MTDYNGILCLMNGTGGFTPSFFCDKITGDNTIIWTKKN